MSSRLRRMLDTIRKHRRFFYYFFLLCFWKAISVLVALDSLRSIYAFLNELLFCFFLLVICLTVWRTSKQFNRVIFVLVLSALIVSVIGVIEAGLERNVFADYAVFVTETDYLERSLGERTRDGSYRVTSSFVHPLALAQFIIFILPITIATIIVRGRFVKILSVAALFLMMIVAFKTGSRSPIVVMILMGMFVLGVWFFKKNGSRNMNMIKIVLFPIVLCVAIVALYWISQVTAGRTEDEQLSSASRVVQLVLGSASILEAPFFGHGIGMSLDAIGLSSIDNYYLSLAIESGLPSALFLLALCFTAINIGLQNHKNCDDSKLRIILLSITTGIVGLLIFFSILSLVQVMPYLFIGMAMIVAFSQTKFTPRQ